MTIATEVNRYGRLCGRSLTIALVLGALSLVTICAAFGTTPKADAWSGAFCNGYVAPWGQPGDSCAAPEGNWENTRIGGVGFEHSMCIDALNQSGAWIDNWHCSAGPKYHIAVEFPGVWQSVRGIARNNTTGDVNNIYACQQLCTF